MCLYYIATIYFYKIADKYNSIQNKKKSLPIHFVLKQFIILVFFRAICEKPKHRKFSLSTYDNDTSNTDKK